MNKVKVNVTIVALILISLIPIYKLKSRLGIDFFHSSHGPELIEKWTGGLIKAEVIKRNYIRRP